MSLKSGEALLKPALSLAEAAAALVQEASAEILAVGVPVAASLSDPTHHDQFSFILASWHVGVAIFRNWVLRSCGVYRPYQ